MTSVQTNHSLISVIIPVYNAKQTLKNTLISVLEQTHKNLEVIVVDDGSNISPEPIINQLEDIRIRFFRAEHGNANTARNHGILLSQGKYIAMLDADDRWLPNHLAECVQILEKSNADGLYGSLFLSRGEANDEFSNTFTARELHDDESMIDYLLSNGYGAQTSTIFTTAESTKDIMWDPDLIDHQDYDFVVRYAKKYKIVPKKKPTVIYYLASGRQTHYESCIAFVEKNKQDVNHFIYYKYNRSMFVRALNMNVSDDYINYFRKEVTRYKEYLSYQEYISIKDPLTRIQALICKIFYITYLFKIRVNLKSS